MVVKRMCAVCRNRFEKNELIRIIKTSDGEIKLDDTKKADGRGMYICKNEECISSAEKRKVIERAFSCSAQSEIYEQIREFYGKHYV